jgi:hypothetical protein
VTSVSHTDDGVLCAVCESKFGGPGNLEAEAERLFTFLAGVPAVEEALEALNHQN